MQNLANYTLAILYFLEVMEGYSVKVMMSVFLFISQCLGLHS